MGSILFTATLLAIFGAYLNSIGNRNGFLIWIGTNIVFMINNILIDQTWQALLFAVYLILAVNGWRNSKVGNEE